MADFKQDFVSAMHTDNQHSRFVPPSPDPGLEEYQKAYDRLLPETREAMAMDLIAAMKTEYAQSDEFRK